MARYRSCIESTDRVIDEVVPDLTVRLPLPEPPKLVRLLRTVVKPDRLEEYMALIRTEIVPPAKKSGMPLFHTSRTRFGGPVTEFRTVTVLNGWADLDGTAPVVTALGGRDAYQKFLAKQRQLIVESDVTVLAHQADISYLVKA